MKPAIRLAVLILLISVTWPAAAVPQALDCRAVGTMGDGHAFPDGGYLEARGTCTGGLSGPYNVTIFTPWGSGGVIPCTFGPILEPIPVTVTLTNVHSGTTTSQVQKWALQATPYVPAITVTIRDAAGGISTTHGAGVIITRIFGALDCDGGQPTASFDWVFVK